jgi:hypothetical protein
MFGVRSRRQIVSGAASQRSRRPTQVRSPGSRAFHQHCMPIPSGATIWPSDPSWSPTSPSRSIITPAKVTPGRSGLQREVTRAPLSSAKSPYGEPLPASTPKTRDQPEEHNSKRSRPSGSNASTGLSRLPPTRQQPRRPTSDRQDAPPVAAATPTGSARTTSKNGVPAGRPRPADSTGHSRHIAPPGTQTCTPHGDRRTKRPLGQSRLRSPTGRRTHRSTASRSTAWLGTAELDRQSRVGDGDGDSAARVGY